MEATPPAGVSEMGRFRETDSQVWDSGRGPERVCSGDPDRLGMSPFPGCLVREKGLTHQVEFLVIQMIRWSFGSGWCGTAVAV